MNKEISRPRKYFRRALLGLLLLSFIFFATIVTLRMNRSAHWHMVRNYQEQIFQADVLQHRFALIFQDDSADFITAEKMLGDSFFSPIYAEAGLSMMQDLANKGLPEAQTRYGDLIMRGFDINDEHEMIPRAMTDKSKAYRYYELAALQGHEPAKEKLSGLMPPGESQ